MPFAMLNDASNHSARVGHDVNDSGRLPTNVKPIHYKLTLAPDLETFAMAGSVEILLDVIEDSKSITLNSVGLDIADAQIRSGGRTVDISISYNQDAQTANLAVHETLPAGREATVVMKFHGKLTEEPAGIYLAKYGSHDGKDQHVMLSQMQPVDCRRAFPCFDEPALRATFETTMIADKALTCLSNMDVKHVEEEGARLKKWVFNTTPPMSTYILAFAAGEFKMIETDAFRVPVRVYTTPNNNIDHGRFALDLGAKTLKFFEDKFDLPFPLPKMDMLGSPHFVGAMENWGLVLYEDRYIVLDEKTGDSASTQLTVMIVQHELAHQWFGNIVTMEYWDGLWLNESFATWAALYGNDHLHPEWKLWQFNLTDEYAKAFQLDSLRSSHPVEVPVRRAGDINQIFDNISYSKGSCVLRMITKYIGEETFLEGIRNYLKKHKYGNTKTDDLWDALTQTSGKDIRKFGDAWTRQIGHPILTVTEGDDCIRIRQNRFLRTGDVQDSEDLALYPIFLGLRTSQGIDEDLAFDQREITVTKTDDFFKVNANHVGLYRTLYQPERLEKLVAARAHLTPEDRFSLIDDTLALAASGHHGTTQALWLIEQFNRDSEYIIWKGIVSAIHTISAAWIFEDDKVKRGLKLWQRRVVSSKAHEVGWTIDRSDGHVDQQLKVLLFAAAVRADDALALQAALHMFANFKNGDSSAINPNITLPVYVAALTHGTDKEANYGFLLDLYRTATTPTVKRTALQALGSARHPRLIRQTLDLMLSDEVTEMTIYLPLEELCKSESGLRASLRWLTANFDKIEKKMSPGLSQLNHSFGPIVGNVPSGDDLNELQDFFETKSGENYKSQLEQEYDEARVKIGWVNRDRGQVEAWLRKEGLM